MEKFGLNLKGLLEEFKTDDGYDIDKAQEKLQSQVDGFAAKQKPDMESLKKDLSNDAVNDFITNQKIEGVENVEQFKAHVKRLGSGASELSEVNATLTSTNEKLKKDYETLLETNNTLTSKVTGFERSGLVTNKGFNSKYLKAVTSEAESRMTDDVDFDKALDLVKDEYPEFLSKKSKGNPTPRANELTEDEEKASMRKAMGM